MSERRSVFILFIIFMLCISIWRISLQELHNEYTSYDVMESQISNNNNNNNGTKFILNTTPLNAAQYATDGALTGIDSRTDANILIDLHNFNYQINRAACPSSDNEINNGDTNMNAIDDCRRRRRRRRQPSPMIALILVHSAPKNRQKRMAIRESWGSQIDPRIQTYFLLGAVNSSTMQWRIKQENDQFHDIIQGNFFDTYRNMTYKHTMALKWFVYNCPKLKFLLKTDDDVFVNTPAVLDFMSTMVATNDDRNLLFCFRVEEARIKRTYRSKWRVSIKEFPGWYYPPYCPGFSIIYSADVVRQLYREAQQRPYFWIDDVHITGSLAQRININITTFGKYYMNRTCLYDLIDDKIHLNDIKPTFLFTEPNLSEIQIRQLWKIVTNSSRFNMFDKN